MVRNCGDLWMLSYKKIFFYAQCFFLGNFLKLAFFDQISVSDCYSLAASSLIFALGSWRCASGAVGQSYSGLWINLIWVFCLELVLKVVFQGILVPEIQRLFPTSVYMAMGFWIIGFSSYYCFQKAFSVEARQKEVLYRQQAALAYWDKTIFKLVTFALIVLFVLRDFLMQTALLFQKYFLHPVVSAASWEAFWWSLFIGLPIMLLFRINVSLKRQAFWQDGHAVYREKSQIQFQNMSSGRAFYILPIMPLWGALGAPFWGILSFNHLHSGAILGMVYAMVLAPIMSFAVLAFSIWAGRGLIDLICSKHIRLHYYITACFWTCLVGVFVNSVFLEFHYQPLYPTYLDLIGWFKNLT